MAFVRGSGAKSAIHVHSSRQPSQILSGVLLRPLEKSQNGHSVSAKMQIFKLPRSIVPEKVTFIELRTAGNFGGAISLVLAVFRRRGIPGVETGTWYNGKRRFLRNRALRFQKSSFPLYKVHVFTLGISR